MTNEWFEFISIITTLLSRINLLEIESATNLLQKADKIYLVGNGASATMANHYASDFMKGCWFKAISLCSNNSIITAIANDDGYKYTYSEQLKHLITEKDLLIAISSSGKSENIINACLVAEEKNAKIITLTGFNVDNPVNKFGDVKFYIDSKDYGIVESSHNIILHYLVDINNINYRR